MTRNSSKMEESINLSIEFNENEIENYLESHITKLLKWVDFNV